MSFYHIELITFIHSKYCLFTTAKPGKGDYEMLEISWAKPPRSQLPPKRLPHSVRSQQPLLDIPSMSKTMQSILPTPHQALVPQHFFNNQMASVNPMAHNLIEFHAQQQYLPHHQQQMPFASNMSPLKYAEDQMSIYNGEKGVNLAMNENGSGVSLYLIWLPVVYMPQKGENDTNNPPPIPTNVQFNNFMNHSMNSMNSFQTGRSDHFSHFDDHLN